MLKWKIRAEYVRLLVCDLAEIELNNTNFGAYYMAIKRVEYNGYEQQAGHYRRG
jgi:hypothetical protein